MYMSCKGYEMGVCYKTSLCIPYVPDTIEKQWDLLDGLKVGWVCCRSAAISKFESW